MPSWLKHSLSTFEVKLDPGSIYFFKGTPWLDMYLEMNLGALSDLLLLQVKADCHQDKQSTATNTSLSDSLRLFIAPQKAI